MTEIGVHPETAATTPAPGAGSAARQRTPHASGKIHIRLSDWIGSVKRMMKRKKLLPKLRLRKKVKKAGDAPDGPSVPVPPSPLETVFLPELVGNTTLLTDEARLCLMRHLPGRVEGHPWQLVFSTGEHGFSLKTLYRQAVEFDCPMLLVIEDSFKHVFGAVCTDPIRFGKHYYGTGESFLFTLRPEFRAFRWSGENQYFARGSTDCLEFGSGDGRSGLFLDEGLVRGYTQPCQTYNNDPLTITKDFGINAVELWALG